MSKFVNYNKRDILLPPGCKDLIDVLQLHGVPRHIKSIAPGSERPTVTRGGMALGQLSEIPRYVGRLVKSRSVYFTLMISTIDRRLSIVLNRSESEGVSALVFVTSDAERERAIREFLQRRDISLLRDYLLLTEAGPVRSLTYLLPLAPPHASQITTELLRTVYSFTDESKIRFQYYDFG